MAAAPAPTGGGAAPAPVVRPTGARAILDAAAPAIQGSVSGTFQLRGERLLAVRAASGSQQMLKVGDTLNITIEAMPYSLEIVGIDTTSFILQYQGERLTLPISAQTGKSQ